jgi:hypothetical protein
MESSTSPILTATLIAAGGRTEGPLRGLSDAAVRANAALGVGGAILLIVLIVNVTAGRLAVARPILQWGTLLAATMLLTGAVPWNATRWPVLVLLATLAGWSIALTVAVLAGAKRLWMPFAMVAAAVRLTAFASTLPSVG